jgi:hypothetical protein
MPESGFVVRFEGKEEIRCASIDLDYDSWEYKTNGREVKSIPTGIKTISIEVEEG